MLPVKVCGITRVEDALLAAELGAAAVGFIFYPKSPRCVNADEVRLIGEQLPPHLARVGVFVNPDPETLHLTADFANLTHIQLAGEESPHLCRESPLPVIKTIRSTVDYSLAALENFPAAAFLVESGKNNESGSAEKSHWEFCRRLRETQITILAGALTSENLAAAVATALPDAIDISSSVESSYGVKDRGKLQKFFAAVGALAASASRLPKGFFSLISNHAK